MKFEDCEVGQTVRITLKNDDNKISLESKIMNIIDDCLVVEAFRMQDAIVNIPRNVEIEMIVIRPMEVPYYWQRIQIEAKIYHDQNVHIIKSKLPGVRLNRRNTFRVPLSEPCKMTDGDTTKQFILKDLSSSGFSILTDKSIEFPLHSKVTVEYADQKYKKYFELSGRPIRKEETDHGNVYGCVLGKRLPDLEGYLNEKQMEHRPNRAAKN